MFYNIETETLKRWHIHSLKKSSKKNVGQYSLGQEKIGISSHIIMTKKSILNSLNFFNTNDRFFHDKVVPSFEEKNIL